MDLKEFREKHNNDSVFELVDSLNELAETSFNHIENTRLRNNEKRKLKLLFYYIFIHNVGFNVTGVANFNNKFNCLECSCLNYKKIDKPRYPKKIKILNDNQFIFYPLLGTHSSGKDLNTMEPITKPVKVDRTITEKYSEAQLKLLTTYLVGQKDGSDPEGVRALCLKVGFLKKEEAVIQNALDRAHTKDIKELLQVAPEIKNRVHAINLSEFKHLNSSYYARLFNTKNFNKQ